MAPVGRASWPAFFGPFPAAMSGIYHIIRAMRVDKYTKTILTVIALLLAAIVLKPIVQPIPASAQVSLNGVQFIPASNSFDAFDTKNGDVWFYSYDGGRYSARYLGRITQLGQTMIDTLQAPPAQR